MSQYVAYHVLSSLVFAVWLVRVLVILIVFMPGLFVVAECATILISLAYDRTVCLSAHQLAQWWVVPLACTMHTIPNTI